jgi:hypothetical protein
MIHPPRPSIPENRPRGRLTTQPSSPFHQQLNPTMPTKHPERQIFRPHLMLVAGAACLLAACQSPSPESQRAQQPRAATTGARAAKDGGPPCKTEVIVSEYSPASSASLRVVHQDSHNPATKWQYKPRSAGQWSARIDVGAAAVTLDPGHYLVRVWPPEGCAGILMEDVEIVKGWLLQTVVRFQ